VMTNKCKCQMGVSSRLRGGGSDAETTGGKRMIGYRHHTVISLSAMLCNVAKRYILQRVSEQVNRNCP